jgi:hypothetical protein
MHAQEAVIDALTQAVLVDRVAEIAIGVSRFDAQRRRRHAKLVRRFKILEDHTPGAVVAGAAAVTLVDNHQVEKPRRKTT